MAPEPVIYTVDAEPVAIAWHLTVRELPLTWTVAFSPGAIEDRARMRIALDLGVDPLSFGLMVVRPFPASSPD